MRNPMTMTLSEIDSAIARNIMKWRRLTRSAVESRPDFVLYRTVGAISGSPLV